MITGRTIWPCRATVETVAAVTSDVDDGAADRESARGGGDQKGVRRKTLGASTFAKVCGLRHRRPRLIVPENPRE